VEDMQLSDTLRICNRSVTTSFALRRWGELLPCPQPEKEVHHRNFRFGARERTRHKRPGWREQNPEQQRQGDGRPGS
jgi:hypothetical protein